MWLIYRFSQQLQMVKERHGDINYIIFLAVSLAFPQSRIHISLLACRSVITVLPKHKVSFIDNRQVDEQCIVITNHSTHYMQFYTISLSLVLGTVCELFALKC